MFVFGSSYPVNKLALNTSLPPMLAGSLRMFILFIFLIPFCKFKIPDRKYFLSGIINLQNGRRQIKSINILKDPASIGGKDVFKASLLTGYELPKTNIINKIKR